MKTNVLSKNLITLFLLFVSSTIFSQENPVDVYLTNIYDLKVNLTGAI